MVEIPAQNGVIECCQPWSSVFSLWLGAGRAVKTDALDYETGLFLRKKVGIRSKGEIVISICKCKISRTSYRFQKYVKIKVSDEALTLREIIEIISNLKEKWYEVK